ncbi:sulfate/molybdate ABC transporter ATP-binding protein [Bacillus sp. FJAT-45350]|uniref:sulfate/molybdate ABC transporter ATP-binding protein n=1 Tax=Bacillus sp. FJAT-45350 TaxID=2011014 RepID=UPI000BB6C8E0|nr:ABC transporter ATP-binding protein [Bacillus sp. FJAT-45350]
MLEATIHKNMNQFSLDVSFKADNGVTGILGPSGCGKSLTLQCLAGLQTPAQGEIKLGSGTLFSSNNKKNLKTRNRQIGYVFQNYALFPHLTVYENIAFGLKGLAKIEVEQLVKQLLSKIQLEKYEKHYPFELSGGQQQRVALARTLITEPKLLLLDEPFSALDYHVKHLLEQELLNIIKENFSGVVLLVTHNMEEAYRLCDKLLLMNEGSIVQSGRKDEVFKRPTNKVSAKIIGCKNIIPISSIDDDVNFIGVNINDKKVILPKRSHTREINYVGIHSEEIQFTNSMTNNNSFDFEVVESVTGIYNTSLTLDLSGITIQAVIPNDQVNSLYNHEVKVYLPPERLFLMTD